MIGDIKYSMLSTDIHLGQIDYRCFSNPSIFAIIQLLFHVNAFITSACKIYKYVGTCNISRHLEGKDRLTLHISYAVQLYYAN